ncbi:MAG: S-layer homology domain-containing protein, partial [Clostridia bacterium]|nr:S-layer homology domain-containing protein [Clostridia bacterium]
SETNRNAWWLVNHVYILDDDFNITGSYTHKSLPVGMSWSNGRLYVKTAWDGIYSTGDGKDYRAESITELPQNEWVYHPKSITFGDYLDSKTAPHKINISGYVTELTDNEYIILYEAIKDIPLRSYMRHSGGTTGMPYISLDDQTVGRGLTGGIYHGGEYYALTSSEDYSKVDKLLNYFLYMGENADRNELNISDWAYSDIKTAMEYGIADTRLITYGGPRDVTRGITRIEFCRLAKNTLLLTAPLYMDAEADNGFSDIYDTEDALLASKLAELGIIYGYEDGTFRPENGITRQEAAVILSRMLGVFGMTAEADTQYADMTEVQDWARDGVSVTAAYGIMNGVDNNCFDPDGTYTIEQSIVTMLREFNAMTDNGELMISVENVPHKTGESYVLYREGYRNGRIELCVYETEPDSAIVNDFPGVVTVSGSFNNDRKYYLSDSGWVWFESGYSNISNNASVIFAEGRY